MELDKLAINTRSRSGWQALDLGCKMSLRWYWPLLQVWLAINLPFFLITLFFVPNWSLPFCWLLMPWSERVMLYMISREMFGERVSVTQAISQLWTLSKNGLIRSMTVFRLSPSRGFNLCVTILEGLSSDQRQKRLYVLHRSLDDNSGWWTICCFVFSVAFGIALFSLAALFIPESQTSKVLEQLDEYYTLYFYIPLWLAIGLVTPVYICGSFASYLNRRIQLEAWDIELQFKQMRKRFSSALTVLCVVIVSTVATSYSPTSWAQDAPEEATVQTTEQNTPTLSPESEQRRDALREEYDGIMNKAPFNGKENVTRWRWTGWKFPEGEKSDNKTDLSFFAKLGEIIATFVEVIFWIVVVVLVSITLYLNREHLKQLFSRGPQNQADAEMPLFTKRYHIEGLPDDIPGEIQRLLELQLDRQALSLMLIASLTRLHQQFSLPLHASLTEQECLGLIREHTEQAHTNFMQSLIGVWIRLAWAHESLDTATVHELAADWKQLFYPAEETAQ